MSNKTIFMLMIGITLAFFLIEGCGKGERKDEVLAKGEVTFDPVDDFIGLWTAAGGEAEGTIKFARPNIVEVNLSNKTLNGTFELIQSDSITFYLDRTIRASYTHQDGILKMHAKGENEIIYRKVE